MKYQVMILVELPDGQQMYCPVVHTGQQKIMSQPSKKEARYWVEFILPNQIKLVEKQ